MVKKIRRLFWAYTWQLQFFSIGAVSASSSSTSSSWPGQADHVFNVLRAELPQLAEQFLFDWDLGKYFIIIIIILVTVIINIIIIIITIMISSWYHHHDNGIICVIIIIIPFIDIYFIPCQASSSHCQCSTSLLHPLMRKWHSHVQGT